MTSARAKCSPETVTRRDGRDLRTLGERVCVKGVRVGLRPDARCASDRATRPLIGIRWALASSLGHALLARAYRRAQRADSTQMRVGLALVGIALVPAAFAGTARAAATI